MATVAIEGVGASVSFGTSGIDADLISLTMSEKTRETIDTTHLGTTTRMTSQPAKLADSGTIQMVFDHDPAQTVLIDEDPETITITYPLYSGYTTATTVSFSGYATSEGGEEMMVGDRMRTSVTIQITGDITITEGS